MCSCRRRFRHCAKKYLPQAVADFESARARFTRLVDRFDEKVALIVGLNQNDKLKALLEKNNILTLTMPTTVERQDMIGTGIRKAIIQINPNLTSDEVEKFVKQAIERSISKTTANGFSESGLMQHELCHTWLNAYVHRLTQHNVARPQTYVAYGTILPDWLDEAIAISCENESDREQRINGLNRAQEAEMIAPLASFLEAEHPRNSREVTSKEPTGSNSQGEVKVSVKITTLGSVSPTIAFYGQAYGVLNFLEEISGRSDIVGQIITAFLNGKDARTAVLNGVSVEQKPLSLLELEQLWMRWLASNLQPATGPENN